MHRPFSHGGFDGCCDFNILQQARPLGVSRLLAVANPEAPPTCLVLTGSGKTCA